MPRSSAIVSRNAFAAKRDCAHCVAQHPGTDRVTLGVVATSASAAVRHPTSIFSWNRSSGIHGMVVGMGKRLATLVAMSILTCSPASASAEEVAAWTIMLRPTDFVIGAALVQLRTRRTWIAGFNEGSGSFEIAVRKNSVAVRAPRCRMDFLILTIPFYYPETPKQASVTERRAIYDAFVAFQAGASGSLAVRVEAPASLARIGANGIALAACNLYFAFPLSVQVSAW